MCTNKGSSEVLSIDEQICEAKNILGVINGWINNCDAKAGIMLAFVGVSLTIIFTNNGLNVIYNIICEIFASCKSCLDAIYLILLMCSLFTVTVGLRYLVLAIRAQVNMEAFQEEGLITNSKIFFGRIGSRGSTYEGYKKKFCAMTKQEYLNDLTSQVYVNSKIAAEKYMNYKRGFMFGITGLVSLSVIMAIGLALYL